MKDLAERALNAALVKGASYADVRAIESRERHLSTRNGVPAQVRESESLGLGVRVIADGAWGFAATDLMTLEGVEAVAARAVAIARSSALGKKADVVLAAEQKIIDSWEGPAEIDPFQIPISQSLDLLLKADAEMRRVKGVTLGEASMEFRRTDQLFLSSLGSEIRQKKTQCGAGIVAVSFSGDEIQKRSYPNSFGGQHQIRGYELVQELDLVGHAGPLGEEAVALHRAEPCPVGTKDIILDGSQLGLQVHESVGHPIELDRVLGMEANFAGRSFLTLDQLGKLRYGSEVVNVVADATAAHGPGLGIFAYDDEGVAAQRTPIIERGIFRGYITSRETAPAVGESRSNGAMRAEGWNRIPLIRMTNISLLPGTWKFDDLIASTDDGIYMETNRSWSIDDKRYNFQFGTEIAWEIKGGKRGRMLKNPSYGGISTDFWNACDAVCDQSSWVLWGTPNCGKGQPMQTMGTGHGASPARFRNIQVGVVSRDSE